MNRRSAAGFLWMAAVLATGVPQGVRADTLPGGIYVERVGGTGAFGAGTGAGDSTTGLPVFVDSVSVSGTPISPQLTLSLSTVGSTGVRPLTDVGQAGGSTAAAVSIMQMSPNGRYLTLVGWDVAAGSNVANTNKTVGVIDAADRSVSTQFGFSSTAQPRSIVTVDKTGYWFVGAANGIRYVTPNANPDSPGSTLTLSASNVNQRTGSIYGGQFFVSGTSSVATNGNTPSGQPGIAFLGVGIPTTVNQTQTYIMNTAGGTNVSNNPEQFVMLDLDPAVSYVNGTVDTRLDTAYVGVDGGVQKWTYNGSAWTLAYTLGAGLSADPASKLKGGLLGVAYAGKDSAGNPILYATTAGNSTVTTSAEGNALLKLVDTGSGADSWQTVLTSPDNAWFRGVQVVKAPGDANGNWAIDSDDFAILDRGFAEYAGGIIPANAAAWTDGDFSYDGQITSADYLILDTAFGQQGGVFTPDFLADRASRFGEAYVTELLAGVPEPASIGLLAFPLAMMRRRHR